MTVNIPQKAGFVPTPEEWAQLVRIAENLAAQVVQRDQANMKITFDTQEKFNQLSGDLYEAHTKAAQIQAERDAARAELVLSEEARSALRLEVARLTAALVSIADILDVDDMPATAKQLRAALRQPAQGQYPLDDEPCDNCVHGKKWHWDGGKCQNACPCEQYKPAPAQGQE